MTVADPAPHETRRPGGAASPALPARAASWARRAQWLLIPLLVLAAAEWVARGYARRHPPPSPWDTLARRVKQDRPLDYIFVGSSRVGCAIDADQFAEEMGRRRGRPAQAVNFGLGYSQMPEHYLNLRNYFRRHPSQTRGCVVFIESAGAFPDPSEWQGPWHHPDRPEMLTPLLCVSDFRRLWNTQPGPESGRVALAYLTRHVSLLNNRQRIGDALMNRVRGPMAAGLARFTPAPAAVAAADLRTGGGVRNDEAGVALARRLAVEIAQNDLRCQASVGGWDGRVVADVVRLVHQQGGQVVFFNMPLHSVQAAAMSQTAVRRADHDRFLEQARAWGTPFIEPGIVTQDEDFPDYWHLRASRVAEYTQKIAEAWVRSGDELPAPDRRDPE
jgi:hypothetical protein